MNYGEGGGGDSRFIDKNGNPIEAEFKLDLSSMDKIVFKTLRKPRDSSHDLEIINWITRMNRGCFYNPNMKKYKAWARYHPAGYTDGGPTIRVAAEAKTVWEAILTCKDKLPPKVREAHMTNRENIGDGSHV